MSGVILDFPAGRCPYDDCSYDGIQHQHAIPDAEVVAAAPRDTVTVERLADALPKAINFRFLPPRIVNDPIWTEVAADLLRALGESPNPTTDQEAKA